MGSGNTGRLLVGFCYVVFVFVCCWVFLWDCFFLFFFLGGGGGCTGGLLVFVVGFSF